MNWINMLHGVPDYGKPCIIKLYNMKSNYEIASFELLMNEGIWVTEGGIRHVRQVSHWAYITPPR